MPAIRGTSFDSDSLRDAKKYYKLLLAIENATGKVGTLEKAGRAGIDEVLESLLPDLVDALDAAQAFVAQPGTRNHEEGFEVIAVYPKTGSNRLSLPQSKLMNQVFLDGKARVVESGENAPQKFIKGLEFFQVLTAVLVRMQIRDQFRIVGVCNRSDPTMGSFLATDRRALESITGLIALGLRMGERRRQELQAVINASKVITDSVGLSHQKILERILEQAVETVKGSGDRKAALGTMQRLDEKSRELVFECVYPPLQKLRVELGDRLPLEIARGEKQRSGISVRAANSRQPQIVHNVRLDPDYVVYYDKTRSELAVPLLDGDRLIGVLDVENEQEHAFDEEDVEALQALADMAVVALRNAKGAGELSFANTVASLGAWGAEIAHDVNRETGAIQRKLYLLQRQHPTNLSPEIRKVLEEIESYAESLVLPPLPKRAPKPGEVIEIKNAANLDLVVSSYIDAIRTLYPQVTLEYDLCCEKLRVAMHERWLHGLLRHLVRNAIKSTEGRDSKYVLVRTIVQGNFGRIEVKDTGKGVRPELSTMLFQQPIHHEDDDRDGQGLLIARFLAERHGGEIGLSWSQEGEGSCFYFTIPIVKTDTL